MVEVGEAISPPLFLLLQGDVGMGEPHSQLAIYALAERQTCDQDLRKKLLKKGQQVVNFHTTETKLVAVYSSQGEDT